MTASLSDTPHVLPDELPIGPSQVRDLRQIVALMPVSLTRWRVWFEEFDQDGGSSFRCDELNASDAGREKPTAILLSRLLDAWVGPPTDARHKRPRKQDWQNFRGREVLLLLPASRCFAAAITTDGLPRRNRQQAMVYRFEEQLPLDAEQLVVAEFLGARSPGLEGLRAGSKADEHGGHRKLLVGVDAEAIEPVLREVEQAGLKVVGITPEPLLLLSGLLDVMGQDPHHVLLQSGTSSDLFQIQSGQVREWQHFACDARLDAHLRLEGEDRAEITLHDLAPERRIEVVGQQSVGVLDGKQSLAVNLASSALTPRGLYDRLRFPLAATTVATALLLSVIIGINLLTLSAHNTSITQHQNSLRQIFTDTFPDQRLPPSVLSRLESEARRVQATRGDKQTRFEPAADVLSNLSGIVAVLPADTRLQIDDLRIDGKSLYLAGQARSHAGRSRSPRASGNWTTT